VPFFPLTTLCTKRTSPLSISQTRQDCIRRNRRLIFHLSPAFGYFSAPRRHTVLSADSGTAACLLTSQLVARKSFSLGRLSPRSRRKRAAAVRRRCAVAVVVDTHRFVSAHLSPRPCLSTKEPIEAALVRFDSLSRETLGVPSRPPGPSTPALPKHETRNQTSLCRCRRAVTCLRAHLQPHLPTR
jgi:hypothetical protein